ncbi:MAG: ADP-ribosylglycohydrolase family protein, partial [Chloroflexi bacterium]|nr:ADP-ribosylglycohydrolase family protein [Chloroflexota bacterium]
MTEPTPDRLAGAVWGHLVGDAFGVPYEFGPPRSPSELRWGASGSHGQPAGTWSDDGALMLALLDSLLPDGARVPHDVRFDLADQGRRALDWADRGAYTPDGDGRFDIGRATAAALMALRAGAAPADAGRTDERAQGNGSLMRILPIALTGTDPLPFPELVERAHQASRVTHGHPACQVACALYVFICRELLRGQRDRLAVLAQTRQKLRLLYEGRGRDPRRPDHLAALDSLEAWTERTGRTFVLDSFWSAWDAFSGSASFAETIERAVAYGNDTDTTACIAGGMAGIYFGEEAIPPEWRAGLRGGDI